MDEFKSVLGITLMCMLPFAPMAYFAYSLQRDCEESKRKFDQACERAAQVYQAELTKAYSNAVVEAFAEYHKERMSK